MTMISIIIPVWNMADKIGDCLKSIADQTYQNYEIIIVNDGSTDDFDKKIELALKKNNFSQPIEIFNQENKGAPAARNKGFKESKGEYLFFCDADAVLKPDALSSLLEVLSNHPEASYTYSSFYWGRKLFKVGEFDENKLKTGPFIHTMSLIRRSDFPSTGWDESIKKLQDWDLFLTMLNEGHTGIWVDKILFTLKPGGTMSSWFPKIFYKLPWQPKRIRNEIARYNEAQEIIKQKHGI